MPIASLIHSLDHNIFDKHFQDSPENPLFFSLQNKHTKIKFETVLKIIIKTQKSLIFLKISLSVFNWGKSETKIVIDLLDTQGCIRLKPTNSIRPGAPFGSPIGVA